MIINHNISAIDAHRNLRINEHSMDRQVERLSSGLRVNRAGDDASGLAVSEKMRTQVRGLNVAARNAQDGISFIQTAEGWLEESTGVLQRIRELAVQAANGIYTTFDRMQIHVEVEQLVAEIDRIASQAQFNTLRLLRGGFSTKDSLGVTASFPSDPMYEPESGGGITFHVGANMDERLKMSIGNMSASALGLAETGATDTRQMKISISTSDKANRTIASLDEALYKVSRQRADLGAVQNRLEHAVRGTSIAANNLQSAESLIRDADMAFEMVKFVRDNVMTQSSATMLTHANAKPQLVLRIING